MNTETLKKQVESDIDKTRNLQELNLIWKKYLGPKGLIRQLFNSLQNLPEQQRAKSGKEANDLKTFLEDLIVKKEKVFRSKAASAGQEGEQLDFTRPGPKPLRGHLHPLTLIQRRAEEIFQNFGFSLVEGPELETEYYNFDALNIPKDHPARDLWNTFWLCQNELKTKNERVKSKSNKLLLRTHTSPVQIRYMEKNNPPLRIIVPGRCFRHEATDCSHYFQFYHLEGLMVDSNVSVANFKAVIENFFQQFFSRPVKIRLRPSFFPFTEPSFEVDMSCLNCLGSGCSVCSQKGWLEMMGAGMVHPAVFKAAGLNPKEWQGFAFGMGLDRLVMMKYKINDIRLLYSGDLRFLRQF